MEIIHRLQQSTCSGTGTGAQDANCHLSSYGLIRFRDRIYVSNNNELKKIILREFHVKSYSGQPRYQKTLTTTNKFYHWLNLKKYVVEFVARY